MRVRYDCTQTRDVTVHPRRVCRDRHRAGIETAEEGGEILQSRRIQEQHRLVCDLPRLQQGTDAASSPVELLIGDLDLFRVAIREKDIGHLVRLILPTPTEEIDQCCVVNGEFW